MMGAFNPRCRRHRHRPILPGPTSWPLNWIYQMGLRIMICHFLDAGGVLGSTPDSDIGAALLVTLPKWGLLATPTDVNHIELGAH